MHARSFMGWTILRYIKQQNSYSCGPVAILNSLKWGEAPVTYNYHYSQLVDDCKTKETDDREYGTSSYDFDRTLRKYGSKYFKIYKPQQCTYSQFEKHITDGGAAVLCFFHSGGGHFSFFPEYNQETKMFLSINDIIRETFAEQPKEEIMKRFKKRKISGCVYPHVWLLTKRDK